MPSKTKKQHKFMAAVANNPKFAKQVGVSQGVGKEFLSADKGKKFSRGGEMNDKMKMVAKKEVKGHEARMHGKKMAKGGTCGSKRYAEGGKVNTDHLVAKEDKQDAVNKARDAEIQKDREMMEKKYPPKKPAPKKYAKGGSVTRGDGACKKGHTKGKMY